MYVCVSVCAYVGMYVRMYVRTYVFSVYIYTYMIHVCMYICIIIYGSMKKRLEKSHPTPAPATRRCSPGLHARATWGWESHWVIRNDGFPPVVWKHRTKFGKMWQNVLKQIELNGYGWEIPEGNWDSNGKNGEKIIELNGSEMVALPLIKRVISGFPSDSFSPINDS